LEMRGIWRTLIARSASGEFYFKVRAPVSEPIRALRFDLEMRGIWRTLIARSASGSETW
jgi:hypothetical protein